MAQSPSSRKRKASKEQEDAVANHGFRNGITNAILSEGSDTDNDFQEFGSPSVMSDEEDEGTRTGSEEEHPDSIEEVIEGRLLTHGRESPEQITANDEAEPEEKPNYRVEKDASGGIRYVYDEIDPVYDSDDTDAQVPVNTIGNIPLSFYESYPHIGYDINGKKIMRPAAGEALDTLLDSIEVPEGWTGLTDPETGKPLNLSQEELELLSKIQRHDIPEEGYDPFPVSTIIRKSGGSSELSANR